MLTAHEKFSASILIVFVPVYFALFWALPKGSQSDVALAFGAITWLAIWGLLWIGCLCGAIGALFIQPDAFASPSRSVISRMLPLTMLAFVSWANIAISSQSSDQRKRDFAAAHSQELSGLPPQSIIYSQGIPDGGTVIVRSPGVNPETLDPPIKSALTPERLKSCEALDTRDWFCSFD